MNARRLMQAGSTCQSERCFGQGSRETYSIPPDGPPRSESITARSTRFVSQVRSGRSNQRNICASSRWPNTGNTGPAADARTSGSLELPPRLAIHHRDRGGAPVEFALRVLSLERANALSASDTNAPSWRGPAGCSALRPHHLSGPSAGRHRGALGLAGCSAGRRRWRWFSCSWRTFPDSKPSTLSGRPQNPSFKPVASPRRPKTPQHQRPSVLRERAQHRVSLNRIHRLPPSLGRRSAPTPSVLLAPGLCSGPVGYGPGCGLPAKRGGPRDRGLARTRPRTVRGAGTPD